MLGQRGGVAMAPIGFLKRSIHRSVYPVPKVPVPAVPPDAYEAISLDGTDGSLCAWWYHGAVNDDLAPVLIYFHGNGENLATMLDNRLFEAWSAYGVRVVAVDYPGYGRSSGQPDQDSILHCADQMVSHVQVRFPQAPIVLAGWSLGAAVALAMAAQLSTIKGLILLSAWCALRDVARDHYPRMLVRLLLPDHFRSVSLARKVTAPTVLLHGTEDWVVAPSQGARLAELIPDARWVPVANFEHNDLMAAPKVWSEIGQFLHELFGPRQPRPDAEG